MSGFFPAEYHLKATAGKLQLNFMAELWMPYQSFWSCFFICCDYTDIKNIFQFEMFWKKPCYIDEMLFAVCDFTGQHFFFFSCQMAKKIPKVRQAQPKEYLELFCAGILFWDLIDL